MDLMNSVPLYPEGNDFRIFLNIRDCVMTVFQLMTQLREQQ